MGRRPKQKRNISGLRNQPKVTPLSLHSTPTPESVPEGLENRAKDLDKDSDWFPQTKIDSLKPVWDEDESSNKEDAGDVGTEQECGERNKLGREGFHATVMNTAIANEDGPRDEDWIPQSSRRKRVKIASQSCRSNGYVKGPDMASKSSRTKYRYRTLLRNQTALDRFGFTVGGGVRITENGADSVQDSCSMSAPIHKESFTPPSLTIS